MREVLEAGPVPAPLQAGREADLGRLRVGGRLRQVPAVAEDADVPGDAEVVVALPAARVGHPRPWIAEAALAEENVLLGVGARTGDDARLDPRFANLAEEDARRFLGLRMETLEPRLGPRIERAVALLDPPAALLEGL